MEYTRMSPSVAKACLDLRENPEKKILVTSDWHIDNPKCRRDLLFKHLDQAKENNADVWVFGDLFCLMQGKYDPRKAKPDILPEHNVAAYLDAVIEDTASLLEPYKDNIKFISYGNHETSIVRRLETDPIERLITLMNHNGANIVKGGYFGYIKIKASHNSQRFAKVVFYHHGMWGGVVTKGVLGAGRTAAVVPDADYCISGHTHDHWSFTIPRYRISQGELISDVQIHLKTGTYKDEHTQGLGFHAERIFVPKSLKMWWMTAYGNSMGLNIGYFDSDQEYLLNVA